MLEDPGIDRQELTDALRAGYGLAATEFRFVPGYDMGAASYAVATDGSGRVFAKIRFGGQHEVALEVPRALLDAGVANVLAPMRTAEGGLWHPMDGERTLVAFPFVAGRSAIEAGMTGGQWREFGRALRAVHDSGLERAFAGRLPDDPFALPSAAALRKSLRGVIAGAWPSITSPAGDRLAAWLVERSGDIGLMLERSDELASGLGARPFERVLCHADIHAANVLVADDGRVLMIDWDGPMLAPRERDLLFVIGARIARRVEPQEEAWFFDGYGEVTVDPDAIVLFRYERIIEDIAETARSVFSDPQPESSRAAQVVLVESFFKPGGILETVEARATPLQ